MQQFMDLFVPLEFFTLSVSWIYLGLYWSQIFSSDYFYLTVRNIFVSSEHFYSC